MSDTQQGSDWWMASDGKWYPPTQQPGPAQPPPPAGGLHAPHGQPPVPPGYGQPSGAPGHGQPSVPPGYGQGPAPTSGKATAVMVLGILSLVLIFACGLGIIPAFVALILAITARQEVRRSEGRLQGLGQIKAGVICAWITVAVVSLTFVIYVVAGIASSGT